MMTKQIGVTTHNYKVETRCCMDDTFPTVRRRLCCYIKQTRSLVYIKGKSGKENTNTKYINAFS